MKKQIISSFPFLPLKIEYNFVPQFISPEQSLKKHPPTPHDDKHLTKICSLIVFLLQGSAPNDARL